MDEKRSYGRFALWFPVTIDLDSRRVWAVCKDVSASGILVSSSGALQVGEVVAVTFRVSAEGPDKQLAGRIVRVEPPDDNPRAVWVHRAAIEFLEPDASLQTVFADTSSRPPPPL
jgi:hypothetical protein